MSNLLIPSFLMSNVSKSLRLLMFLLEKKMLDFKTICFSRLKMSALVSKYFEQKYRLRTFYKTANKNTVQTGFFKLH